MLGVLFWSLVLLALEEECEAMIGDWYSYRSQLRLSED